MRLGRKEGVARAFARSLALCIAVAASSSAIASEWTARDHVRFRLLPDTTAAGAASQLLVALDIALEPGWQFYWRDPGEYAYPPRFDWRRSRNLARARIHWPAPERFVYSAHPPVSTLGYKGSVLLPVALKPAAPGAAVDLRLDLDYAVCSDICISDKVSLRLRIPEGRGAPTAHSARIRRALAEVPRSGAP